MIHFQPYESGAMLRASEVKPKLDRFIERWMTRGERNGRKIPDGWRLNKEGTALNYKMRFYSQDEEKPVIEEPPRNLFFGNIGSGPKMKTVFYRKPITMQMICFIPALREILRECMELFFLLHNFGTRQNRGFGGFTLINELGKPTDKRSAMQLLAGWFEKKPVYYLAYPTKASGLQLLSDGEVFYKILKSGINLANPNPNKNVYIRSFLTRYSAKLGMSSEKRFMKAENLAPKVRRKGIPVRVTEEEAGKNYYYIRGLFGIPDRIEFIDHLEMDEKGRELPAKKFVTDRSGKRRFDPRKKEYKKEIIKDKILISGKDLGIDRIPSPLFYKICDHTLFMIPYDPENAIMGKHISFRSLPDLEGAFVKTIGRATTKSLQIPEHFQMDAFFASFVAYINKDLQQAWEERITEGKITSKLLKYDRVHAPLACIRMKQEENELYIHRCQGGLGE
ncbi:MAG: hypothetical protein MJ097_02730 [Dorea sp.]|nr:hypothetical protein [Dorea sp.]